MSLEDKCEIQYDELVLLNRPDKYNSCGKKRKIDKHPVQVSLSLSSKQSFLSFSSVFPVLGFLDLL